MSDSTDPKAYVADDAQTSGGVTPPASNPLIFQELIQSFAAKTAELKEVKRSMKEVENDVPMALEDLLIAMKDLRAQVKEQKDDHLRAILETNSDYGDNRERVQFLKEEIAEAKMQLFTMAANESRSHGDLDRKVLVSEGEFRLQTQKEVQVYLNGKLVK
jgi:hypothetical protein